MDARTKKMLVAGCAGMALLLVLAGVAGLYAWRHYIGPLASHRLEMPSSLKTAGVEKGGELLSKDVFWEGSGVGTVTDIAVGEQGNTVIAGSRGAVFVDDSKVASPVAFAGRADHVDVIDVEGDGVCEFMNRGSWAVPASLIDHQGKTVWRYGEGTPGVDDMAAGDIDGDGELEFTVGFNGGGGVHLVETDGQKVWRQSDSNVWHVEMVDTNDDGQLEIVHSNAGGEMKVRDGQGNVIQRSRPPAYFSGFSLCRWPGKKHREYALLSEEGTIWVLDFDGKPAAELEAPDCGRLGHARGTPVRLKPGEGEYFAVVVEFRSREKSIVYVYSSDEELVYQEVLSEACASVAAMSSDESGAERLLVGGEGKVWEYEIAGAE